MHDALEVAENRMRVALADGQAKAAEDLKTAVAAARVKEREIEMAGVEPPARKHSRPRWRIVVERGARCAGARGTAREAAGRPSWSCATIAFWAGGCRDSVRATRSRNRFDLSLADSGVIGLAVGAARAVTTKDSQSAGVGPGFETLPQDRMDWQSR
jgi:hypothetical protein